MKYILRKNKLCFLYRKEERFGKVTPAPGGGLVHHATRTCTYREIDIVGGLTDPNRWYLFRLPRYVPNSDIGFVGVDRKNLEIVSD